MKKTLPLVLLFICFFGAIGFAQNFNFRHYTVSEGLPSSEIFDMVQDETGYLWLATQNGVSRFDGNEFKNYTTADGLPSNSTAKIVKDRKGCIWFCSTEGFLSYYQNKKIITHPLNTKISELSKNSFIDNLYLTSKDELVFMSNKHGVYVIGKDNKIQALTIPFEYSKDYNMYFSEIGDGLRWDRNSTLTKTNKKIQDVNFYKGYYFINLKQSTQELNFKRSICKIDAGNFLISINNVLFHIKNRKIVKEIFFEKAVLSVFVDSKKNVWITTLDKGVLMYQAMDFERKPQVLLENVICSRVLQDKSGSYWFSTLGDGLYCLNNFGFKTYSTENISIKKLYYNDKTFYLLGNNGKVTTANYQNNGFTFKPLILKDSNNTQIVDLLVADNNCLMVLGTKNFKFTREGAPIKSLEDFASASEISPINNSEFVISAIGGYFKYNGTTSEFCKIPDCNDKVTIAFQDKQNAVWLGTFGGLYKHQNKKFEFWGLKSELLKKRVTCINSVKNILIVGTYGSGVVLIDGLNISNFSKKHGLNSDIINCILKQSDSVFWIGTSKGINKLVLKPSFFKTITLKKKLEEKIDYEITQYSENDGLPRSEIYSMINVDSLIWLGSEHYLISFNPQKLAKNKYSAKVELHEVQINGKDTLVESSYSLKSGEYSMTFHFNTIDLKEAKDINYYYKLTGRDTNWVKSKSNFATFSGLKGGRYTLWVYAENIDHVSNKNIVTVEIEIQKSITETTLFKIVVSLFLLIFLISVIWLIYYKNKLKSEAERNLLISEQKAFKAQMNAHFLFNSLNSLQRFIYENNVDLADTYLTTFSSLLRRIMENSRFSSISLYDSIETLELYLQLEKMRFDNSFEYGIIIDSSISNVNSIEIPSMLIQPFVENAIWLGAQPKKKQGKIEINFKIVENQMLLCTIFSHTIHPKIDVTKVIRKDLIAIGMKTIEERIGLLNQVNKTKMKIVNKEIVDINGITVGSAVELFINFKRAN